MRYPHILFDLDGTLIQSEAGIFHSVAYAFDKLQMPCPSKEILRAFLGPPLLYSFEHYCNLSKEEATTAVRFYREFYSSQGLFNCVLYPGFEALLKELTSAGLHLYIATAKPEVFATRILAHLQIEAHFTQIAGPPLTAGHAKKHDIIAEIMNKNNLTPLECVMVGDRHFDIEGATTCGIDSIGVLYGYGSKEELQKAGATHLVNNAKELSSLLFC